MLRRPSGSSTTTTTEPSARRSWWRPWWTLGSGLPRSESKCPNCSLDWACNCFSEFQTMFAEADKNNDGLIGTSRYLVWIKSISIVCISSETSRYFYLYQLESGAGTSDFDEFVMMMLPSTTAASTGLGAGNKSGAGGGAMRQWGSETGNSVTLPFYTLISW